MMRFLIPFLTVLAAAALAGAARADTAEPALYVAVEGHDSSDCTSTSSPCRSIRYA
jgi:hypothetical protein